MQRGISVGRSGSARGMEDKLKKAYLEMLFLFLLSERDMHVPQIATALRERSDGALHIVFPYASLRRLERNGYIQTSEKRAADGRRRQFYQITESGSSYLKELMEMNARFTQGVQNVLTAHNPKPTPAARGTQEG